MDAVIIALTYWLAWFIRFRTHVFSMIFESVPYPVYMTALLAIVPIMLVLYSACNLYSANRVKGRRQEISSIMQANIIALLIFLALLQLLRQREWSR